MRYVVSRLECESEDYTYRIYVTDSLKNMDGNIAAFVNGKHIAKRYFEIITEGNKPEETRTEEDIINSIREKIGAINGRFV